MSILKLTSREVAVILDRLLLHDRLSDALQAVTMPGQDVSAAASHLAACLSADGQVDLETCSQLDLEILRDCVNGSTYLATLQHWRRATARVIIRSIERKFKAAGLDATFPES